MLRLVAAFGVASMPPVRRLTRGHLVGRAVIDRQTIHVRDLAQALAEYPETTAARFGVQSALAVPLLREGVALGVIRISRTEIRPFTDKQIALLQTFADQAVIAIENVRLFTELEARNRDLTDALARQTATAEVLRVISRSQTDVQPVFAAILDCAVRLCGADHGGIVRVEDGTAVHRSTSIRGRPSIWRCCDASYPRPVDASSLTGRAVLEARVIHVPDVEDPAAPASLTGVNRGLGFRCQLTVPILRDGQADRGPRPPASRARPLLGLPDRAGPDLRRPGGHRHRERAAPGRAGGAHGRADALGGAAHRARRGGARRQLVPRARDGAHDHRGAGGGAVRRSTAGRSSSTTRRARTSSCAPRSTPTRSWSRRSGRCGPARERAWWGGRR